MIFKKHELKHLWPFYLERFLANILYFAPAFWILQFQQYFSLLQIGILFSILSLSSFIFEIPTGAVADLYGRKFSVVLGYLLMAISVFLLATIHNFQMLLLVFALWGISGTFISGAKESWVVDNLHYHKKKSLVKEFFIKEQSIILFSLFLSGFIGAYLVNLFGLDIIWFFAAFSYLVTAILLVFIKEHKVTKEKKKSFSGLFTQSKKSIKYALGHHVLLFIILATFFIMFRDSFGGDLVWQPFLRSLGFPIYAFGFLFSIGTLFGVVAPLLSSKILKLFKSERNYLAFLLVVTIILDAAVLLVESYVVAIILFLLMLTTVFMFMPVNQAFFHSYVPGGMRATVASFNGMAIALAYALSFPLSGYCADMLGPRYTIALGSIILIPALILYLRIKDKPSKAQAKNPKP